MKIVGMMVLGPQEPLLKPCLERIERLNLDHFVVAGNNTDAESEKLIKSLGWEFYRDDREWGKYQPNIKTKLLSRVSQHNPDWIVAQDADEFFDDGVTRETLEGLAEKGGIAWNFYVVNLWNDEEHYAKGLSFWNVRFYKHTPEYGLQFINKPVHCGLAPPMQYKYANDSPFILWHYGLMDREKRLAKVERYKKYDPNAAYKSDIYYSALEETTPPVSLDKDGLRNRVREDVKNRYMKVVKAQDDPEGFAYVEKEGSVIGVPAKDVRRYERQGWKLKETITINESEKMYAEADTTPPETNDMECPICGKISKSKAGNVAHQRAAHEGILPRKVQ